MTTAEKVVWPKITERGYQGFEGTEADMKEVGLEEYDPGPYRFYRKPSEDKVGGFYIYRHQHNWIIPDCSFELVAATLEDAERTLCRVAFELSGDNIFTPGEAWKRALRIEFSARANQFKEAAYALLQEWEKLEMETGDTPSDVAGYPFTESFDEVFNRIYNWNHNVNEWANKEEVNLSTEPTSQPTPETETPKPQPVPTPDDANPGGQPGGGH